jgi:hypothetical protein
VGERGSYGERLEMSEVKRENLKRRETRFPFLLPISFLPFFFLLFFSETESERERESERDIERDRRGADRERDRS